MHLCMPFCISIIEFFIFKYLHLNYESFVFHPASHYGLSATLTTSTSVSIYLSLRFFVFPFYPNWSEQMSAPWSLALL